MIWPISAPAQYLPQGRLPGCQRLTRQTVDQVQIDVVESGIANLGEGLLGSLGAVDAIKKHQLGRIERLYAHRDPVDAGLSIGRQTAWFNTLRIGLERDLSVGRERDLIANRIKQLLHRIAGQEARRPASDEHRRDRASL